MINSKKNSSVNKRNMTSVFFKMFEAGEGRKIWNVGNFIGGFEFPEHSECFQIFLNFFGFSPNKSQKIC